MARTKQRSRLPRNPRIPKEPPSHPKREYAFKEERNRLLKRKLNQVHSDHHHPNALALTSLCDLEILTLDNSAETRVIISENHNDDMMIAYGFGTSCEYHFYEYRYCGKVCYYLREEQFDMCLLLMNRDEFLYLGQQGAHAFYGLPHFSYVNSDGSSPNVYEEWKDNFSFDDENQVLELGKLLSQVHEFLTGVTANDYH